LQVGTDKIVQKYCGGGQFCIEAIQAEGVLEEVLADLLGLEVHFGKLNAKQS